MNTDLKLRNIKLSAVEAAKMIRADLKKAFPGVKFSVRSESFSQGSAVRVHYTDGPIVKAVEEIVELYGGRGYDGMNEVTLLHDGALRLTAEGPVSYSTYAFLSVSRDISKERKDAKIAEIMAEMGTSHPSQYGVYNGEHEDAYTHAHRYFWNVDLR